MPNRWLAISVTAFWVLMMGLLVERDVVPRWMLQARLDPRGVTRTVQNVGPVRWAVLYDDQRIGWVQTEWRRRPDGWSEFSSQVELKELPWASSAGAGMLKGPLRWESAFHITTDEKLDHFDIDVYLDESRPTMTVRGRLEEDLMHVSFRSGAFTHEEQFYFDSRSLTSLMTASLAPIDRLPNLKVGQTWQDRVMNPLRSTTEIVRSEVVSEQVITWRRDPVPVYLVEHQYGQLRARCWVSHDGMILRQEVPFHTNLLVLEHE